MSAPLARPRSCRFGVLAARFRAASTVTVALLLSLFFCDAAEGCSALANGISQLAPTVAVGVEVRARDAHSFTPLVVAPGRETARHRAIDATAFTTSHYSIATKPGINDQGGVGDKPYGPDKPDDSPTVGEVLKGKKGSVTNAPLPDGSPSWDDVRGKTMDEIERGARANQPGYKTIKKLLTDKRFNK